VEAGGNTAVRYGRARFLRKALGATGARNVSFELAPREVLGARCVFGRKRHMLTDTSACCWPSASTPASVQDRDGVDAAVDRPTETPTARSC